MPARPTVARRAPMLMIPGPAPCAPAARAACALPILPHYGEDYLALHHRVGEGLAALFGTSADVCLLPGPGTAGTEFALCGFAGQEVVVVEAGTFGERLSEILRRHGARVHPVRVEGRGAARPDAVDAALAAAPSAVALAAVHSETSTGVLHPVDELAAVARRHDVLCVVDAVSSLGAVPFAMDAWGVDVAWTASQKALAAPPGMAMVAMSQRAWRHVAGNAEAIGGFLLDPMTWRWHMDRWPWHPYPTSLPTQVVRGLDVVLAALAAEGIETAEARHRRAAAALVAGAASVGFSRWAASDAEASPTVTGLLPPEGLDEARLREHMERSGGVLIAGGFGALRGRIVRIGHMGSGTSEDAVLATIAALAGACREQGVEPADGADPVAVARAAMTSAAAGGDGATDPARGEAPARPAPSPRRVPAPASGSDGASPSDFDTLPEPPAERPDGASVLARLVDALAFRYRWATDGLAPEDLALRPCEGAMSLEELLDHVQGLAFWMQRNVAAARDGTEAVAFAGCREDVPDAGGAPGRIVGQTLSALAILRADLLALGDEGLPSVVLVGRREGTPFGVWNLMNGPLADALTHVGQINAWRRQGGRPAPAADVLRGRPPDGR